AARGSNGGRDCTTTFSRPACSELVEPACRALSTLRGVAGATPSKNGNVTPCHTNVTECHTCDIACSIHKPMRWNGLDLELQPKDTHFREMCDLDFCIFPRQAAAARWASSQSCTRLGNFVTRLPPGACNNM